ACRADQVDRTRVGLDHWLGFAEILRISAHHYSQRSALCARLPARHRSVERSGASCARCFVKLARDGGRRSGVIDEDRALSERSKRAIGPQSHGPEIVVVADAGEDEFGAIHCISRTRGETSAELLDPSFGLGSGAVEDRHVVFSPCLEVPSNGITHVAEPDPSDFAHGFAHPSRSWPSSSRPSTSFLVPKR